MAGSNTSTNPERDVHSNTEEQFSDYYDGSLGAGEREAVERHLGECQQCRAAYEEFKTTVAALSELHKMRPPPSFDDEVQETIRRRSGGRFFGRKAFGDRVPFEVLAIVILAIGLVIFFLLRSSQTGSLRYHQDRPDPHINSGAKDVVPRPAPSSPAPRP